MSHKGLIPHARPLSTATRSNHLTLDAAWQEARSFGRTSLEEAFSQAHCTAKIHFATKAGSTIWATGTGATALAALNAALDEAMALRAGVIFADKD